MKFISDGIRKDYADKGLTVQVGMATIMLENSIVIYNFACLL